MVEDKPHIVASDLKSRLEAINKSLPKIKTVFFKEVTPPQCFSLKLSVIVPIYNSERYLEKAIKSILSQTLHDIEIICVDDGSSDNSVNILERLAKTDERLVVLKKENGGQSSARNAALDIAKGQYIGFVDSDDTIPADYFETLYSYAVNFDADIVQCGVLMISENNHHICPWPFNKDIWLLETRNPYLNKLFLTYSSGFVWNKIYKNELFDNKLRFIEGIYWEDNPFILEICQKAKNIVSINDVCYHYLQRNGSTVHSKGAKVHFDLLTSVEHIIYFLNNNGVSKIDYQSFASSIKFRLDDELARVKKNKSLRFSEKMKFMGKYQALLFNIRYLSLSDKLNLSSEYRSLKKHAAGVVAFFKIVPYLFKLIKYILCSPYYLAKEGWK